MQAGLHKKEGLEGTAEEQAAFPCFPAYLQLWGPACVLGRHGMQLCVSSLSMMFVV